MKEEKLTKKVYSEQVREEWERLSEKDPYHRLEFETTMYFLKKYLPKKGLILDAGGGPGRYTIELARMGYDIILLDLIPENLEFAKKIIKKEKVEGRIKKIIEGSITDLSIFKENTFDAVICLGGPLSHVHPEKNRQKAVSELARVAKKNAPIFISVMMKYAVIMTAPWAYPEEIAMTKHFQELSLRGNDYKWHKKYFCHFFVSEEMQNLIKKANIKFVTKIGLEGLSSPVRKEVRKLKENKTAWENWMSTHYKLCAEPAIADTSMHTLFIGDKK